MNYGRAGLAPSTREKRSEMRIRLLLFPRELASAIVVSSGSAFPNSRYSEYARGASPSLLSSAFTYRPFSIVISGSFLSVLLAYGFAVGLETGMIVFGPITGTIRGN
jgi:hypothetical protein